MPAGLWKQKNLRWGEAYAYEARGLSCSPPPLACLAWVQAAKDTETNGDTKTETETDTETQRHGDTETERSGDAGNGADGDGDGADGAVAASAGKDSGRTERILSPFVFFSKVLRYVCRYGSAVSAALAARNTKHETRTCIHKPTLEPLHYPAQMAARTCAAG